MKAAYSGKVSPEFLQKIKDAVNITDVVGEHVVLRKSGANFSGLCPFHSERTPSFSVSENKQLYHCYGCKKGGDLLSFVMEIHGVSFREAIEELSERAKIALPKEWKGTDSSDPKIQAQREADREKLATVQKLNRFVAHFFHQNLQKFPHAMDYFQKRGVIQELIREFYLGVAPPAWDLLASHLISKQAPVALAVDLGLVRPSTRQSSQSGPGYFDLFRNRAMFPILDMKGKVAGFGGRSLPLPQGAADIGAQDPKYLNSTESILFHKSKLIFGLYQAQKYVREKDEVILVEGYFDVLALHAAGFKNVVATCGTALTIDHLHILRRFTDRIIIFFDGDSAGVSATQRAMELGLQEGTILYGARIPEGVDPDEILFDTSTGAVLAGGIEKMTALLGAARPILDDRIESKIKASHQGPEAKVQSIKAIAEWLSIFKDPVGREVRIQNLESIGISRSLLGQAVSPKAKAGAIFGQARPNHTRSVKTIPQAVKSAESMTLSDRILIGALVKGGDFEARMAAAKARLPAQALLSDLFEYFPAREFVLKLLSEPGSLQKLREFPDSYLNPSLEPTVRGVLTEALLVEGTSVDAESLQHALDRAVARSWARISQGLKEDLARAEAEKNAELQAKLMKEYLDVQRRMKEFSNFYDEA